MYFKNFPITFYQVAPATFRKPAEYVALTDIVRNVRFKKEVLDNIVLYDKYIINDGESIEDISEFLYKSPFYHWVLLLLNDRFDYINDLPLSSRVFEQMVERKYNVIAENGDDPHILETYGATTASLLVDLVNGQGNSVDFNYDQVRLINKSNNQPFFRSVSSVWYYDPVIKTDIKRFVYTDDQFTTQYTTPIKERYVNTTAHQIDWGIIPQITPVSAYQHETIKNEQKREIKVIGSQLLQVVLQNFKDLM